jgi:kinesin family protein 13
LCKLKSKWSGALAKRKEYLDHQLTSILQKSAKTEAENEREQLLVDQYMFLTEELEFVMIPAPGSGVPGAPVDNDPPEGMEQHTPVLFLDLNSDDLSTGIMFSDDNFGFTEMIFGSF